MRKQQSKTWWLMVVLMCLHDSDAQSNWTDKSPHKSGFITANHVKLHYLDWGGKGKTLLFLHGLVAFAGSLFEGGPVEDLDLAPPVADHAALLQRPQDLRDAGAADAEH